MYKYSFTAYFTFNRLKFKAMKVYEITFRDLMMILIVPWAVSMSEIRYLVYSEGINNANLRIF